ncbi:DUF4357 domain-containing protein [Ligilactobacillus sp. Marseille-Q7487]|uniref:DUF4357 domain-containing protein n=1 Tax=Ligilactobacillus sp. Marseille-Q7487 TaxID=3022128 RepID=UPI0024A7B3F5|nr:DUF4357 domain-containing protein [Ligilactobacillus sp. Marseille-Q7487]
MDSKKQLIQLMKDLVGLIEDETKQKQHFLGTVVYLENVVDYKTVSNAATLVLGGSRNGWDYWKDSTGMSINDSLRKKK